MNKIPGCEELPTAELKRLSDHADRIKSFCAIVKANEHGYRLRSNWGKAFSLDDHCFTITLSKFMMLNNECSNCSSTSKHLGREAQITHASDALDENCLTCHVFSQQEKRYAHARTRRKNDVGPIALNRSISKEVISDQVGDVAVGRGVSPDDGFIFEYRLCRFVLECCPDPVWKALPEACQRSH